RHQRLRPAQHLRPGHLHAAPHRSAAHRAHVRAGGHLPMKRTFAGAVALCAALLSGCSESVEPNLGIDRPFTIWGLFNPRADTQAARLFTIESDIQLITSAPIDATITSTDLA